MSHKSVHQQQVEEFMRLAKQSVPEMPVRRVSFSFTEDGSIEAAHNYSLRGTCVQLATPQTQAEVLATLKVCGVEVEG